MQRNSFTQDCILILIAFIALNFCVSCTRGNITCYSGESVIYKKSNVKYYVNSEGTFTIYEDDGAISVTGKLPCTATSKSFFTF